MSDTKIRDVFAEFWLYASLRDRGDKVPAYRKSLRPHLLKARYHMIGDLESRYPWFKDEYTEYRALMSISRKSVT